MEIDSPPSISVDSSSLKSRKSNRSSIACSECRRKKTRCDSAIPVCSNCLASNSSCVVIDTDKRKRKGSGNQVKDLKQQLRELERNLAASLAKNSSTVLSSTTVLESPPPTIYIQRSSISHESPLNFLSEASGSSSEHSRNGTNGMMEVEAATPSSEDLLSAFPSVESNVDALELEIGQQTPWSVAPSALAAQVTGRYGRLVSENGGSLKWYGATSSRHISFGGGRDPQTPDKNLKARCNASLLRLGLSLPLVSPALEERLLQLYFSWHSPFFQCVDEDVFYKHRELYARDSPDCQFYSPALLYAMLSYTVHFSDEAVATLGNIPETAGDKFFERAVACLDQEMDNPQTTTVQALSIMSGREASCGRDTKGWIYIGMAAMISIDLGLHKDSSQWVDAGQLSLEKYQQRNRSWFGMWCYGQLWALYTGRPLVMLSDFDVPHPLISSTSSVFVNWVQVGDLNEVVPAPDPCGSYSDQNLRGSLVLLLQITDSIVKQLYSTLTVDSLTTGIVDWVAEIHARLIEWKTTLSPSLKIIPSGRRPLPHTIILHLQYHSTLILLHRPSLCDQYGKILKDGLSFKTCCISAQEVTRLLETYQKLYSFRRVSVVATHQVFTAATINVFIIYLSASTIHGDPSGEEPILRRNARKGLLVCITALAAIATTQVHARRCYLSIIMLMKKWGISLDEPISSREPINPRGADQYQMFNQVNNAPSSSTPLSLVNNNFPLTATQLNPNLLAVPPSLSSSSNNYNNFADQSQQFDRFSRELLALSDDYPAYNTQGTKPVDHNTPPSPTLHLNPDATTVDPLAFFEFDPYLQTEGYDDWSGPTLFDMFTFP